MKKISYKSVDLAILNFIRNCPKGKSITCSLWGADHWVDGRVFYIVWATGEDWIEIIEPVACWRLDLHQLGLAGEEDEEIDPNDLAWPWST